MRKPVPDYRFSKMSKRWIANVMQKPRTLQNIADIRCILRQKAFIPDVFHDILRNILSKRFSIRGHLQRMCQSRTDKIAPIQRKYLRLILQTPEGCTLYDSVIVLFKFRPKVPCIYISALMAAYPFITKQLFPLHPVSLHTLNQKLFLSGSYRIRRTDRISR